MQTFCGDNETVVAATVADTLKWKVEERTLAQQKDPKVTVTQVNVRTAASERLTGWQLAVWICGPIPDKSVLFRF